MRELREHALVVGEVMLSAGQTRPVLRRRAPSAAAPGRAFAPPASCSPSGAVACGAEAVGGPVMAAIPLACAAIAVPQGEGLVGFFVRKETKAHGLQRMVEGPVEAGTKVFVVEDTVTTGGSTVAAVEQIREQGLEIVGGACVVDRLAGGTDAIAEAIGAPVRGAGHDRRDLPRAPGPLDPRDRVAGPFRPQLGPPRHLAYVVEDIGETVERLVEQLGAGPFFLIENVPLECFAVTLSVAIGIALGTGVALAHELANLVNPTDAWNDNGQRFCSGTRASVSDGNYNKGFTRGTVYSATGSSCGFPVYKVAGNLKVKVQYWKQANDSGAWF